MKVFNALKFYEDFGIKYLTRGHKHAVRGWGQIHCPFCRPADKNYSLGFHIATGAYNCWKCKKHGQIDVVMALTGFDFHHAKALVKEYGGRPKIFMTSDEEEGTKKRLKRVCTYPTGTEEMKDRHRRYLEGRGYDPEKLEREWDLKGTGYVGNYKHRIIAPIYLNGIMVSYQGRDITDKSELKYKACEKVDEVIEHQTILYGLDRIIGRKCLVVEGIADVWRMGYGSTCCFGIAWTIAQINLLAQRADEVFMMFDSEEEAQQRADEMGYMLSGMGVSVESLELPSGDPGEMKQKDADYLMKDLKLR